MSAILNKLSKRIDLSAAVDAIVARPLLYGAGLALIGLTVGIATAVSATNKACSGIYTPTSTELRF